MSTAPAAGPGEPHPEPQAAPQPAAPEQAAPQQAAPEQAAPQQAAPEQPKPRPKLYFGDPLDQQSSDDTDRGWGERPATGGSAADLARFLDEKPPHHI
ncbi:hypothetical protein [Streptomyces sp. NPDC008125]|uniref:hypothetical protein n=1 Tax=Streptomyces sp. NPDC008125 TaxID=3364811 RepID=UPI0036E9BDCE